MFPAGSGAAPASPPAKETRASFGGFPGLVRGSTTNRSANLVEKKDFMPAIYGTSLSLSSFSHQTSHTCGLESNCSAEKKFNSPEDKIGTGGVLTSTFYKDHYKAAMEQLAALNLSKSSRAAQLNSTRSRQGPFHSWSCVHNQGNTSVSKTALAVMEQAGVDFLLEKLQASLIKTIKS